jgi:hypothetical protein
MEGRRRLGGLGKEVRRESRMKMRGRRIKK